jgi:hypothetical protein
MKGSSMYAYTGLPIEINLTTHRTATSKKVGFTGNPNLDVRSCLPTNAAANLHYTSRQRTLQLA